jgi:glycine oxidase
MRNVPILVLGGGIIGCAVAEELARRGRRVTLVERGTIGQEASSAAAGILSAQMDVDAPGPFLDFCQDARRRYPGWVRRLERRTGLRVGLHRDGILYLAMTRAEEARMARRLRWQRRHGLRVERWSAAEVRRREPAVDGRVLAGFFFPDEYQVDNQALMRALAIACRKAGVRVLERTAVRRLLLRRGTVQGVVTDRGRLRARVIVNALGSWSGSAGAAPVRVPVEPSRGQMLAFAGPPRLFRHAVMAERAYVVQRRDGRLLVGSTVERAGFDKSLTLEGMHGILCGLRRFSRALTRCTFLEAWAGLRPYSRTGNPLLGPTRIRGLYLATGHFRHGILLAPSTATRLADHIERDLIRGDA